MNDDLEEKAQETTALVLEASRVVVTNGETYKHAAELRSRCKSFLDYFESLYRPRISEADKLHKNLLADLKKLKDPPQIQYNRLAVLISDFDRRAEDEKRRLEWEAERKRKEVEAQQQRLADLAAELGSTETAEEIEAAPVDPGPVIKKEVPQVEGLHYRHGGWDWKPIDPQIIPDEFWMLDERAITVIVNRLGKQAEKTIPGIAVEARARIPIQR